ncbi:B103 [Murid betaherpesvirus 8]|uniref:B103 n=2 Tax=Rat cytomegalovirus (isolate England) TaxID=1261657 RepID=K7XR39_RCMVE|nr:E103 [Murid betaherpesvirus 8]AKE44269.1 a103 [Rat cytomegalovirus ALL-03]AFX83416.1 E103 [Murid betaherpesvirus 8]AKB93296.1 B103 [Murid betaherpesvirus 8]WEG71889.1 tegument protein UL7 [Murid betaherpesvirus 8]WPH25011.1 B103 [Murid betaherpesvirus 8]
MSNNLMVRGAMEVHNDRLKVRLISPEIVSITLVNGQMWLHTESGKIIPHLQYRTEVECKTSFVGFCLFFILEEEDGLSELRLTSIRARHRLAVFRPKTNTDFSLCLLLYAIESLPLSKQTLENIVCYLNDCNPRTGLAKMIRRSCVRLICASLYLFFDVQDTRITNRVSQVCLLYKETQRANASMIAETYFGKSLPAMATLVSLSICDRRTKDGDLVGELATDVLNTTCNVFYIPVGLNGNTVTQWLSNDKTPCHIFDVNKK